MAGREDYAERVEARRERLENAADKAQARSNAAYASAGRIADGIPMGQPILVGHHSERRHRRDIAKIDRGMRRFVDEGKKAEHLRGAAASVGTGGISSDDPEAVTKLREKIAKLEEANERDKALNGAWRKGKKAGDPKAAILAAGFSEALATTTVETMAMCPWLKGPVDPGRNSAEIRRCKQRIEVLQRETPQIDLRGDEYGGWSIETCERLNRVVLMVGARLPTEIFQSLRRNGWRWSKTEGAFLAFRNNRATYVSEVAARALRGE